MNTYRPIHRVGISLSATLLILALCGCTSEMPSSGSAPKPAGDTLARVAIKKTTAYSEPELENVPLGVAHPPSIGDFPADGITVERTGTHGGTLVYAILGEVETFNPIEPKGATAQELRSLLYSRLVTYSNGDWAHGPDLAKSWDVSDDYKTWTFHIREGIRWSDGKPLTVADVEFTFRCVFHPQIATSIRDGFQDDEGNLPTVTSDPENGTITLTTKKVDSQFLTHIGTVPIIPEHKWADHLQDENPTLLRQMTSDTDPAEMVGSGPFVLHQYVPAEKVVYKRNPYFWQQDSRGSRLPYLDEVVIVLVKDLNLMWSKFEAGELDIFMDLPPDHYKEALALEESGNSDLIRLGVSLNSNWVCFNLHPGIDAETKEPFVAREKQYWFNTLDFRKAVNHAIDRDGIVKTALYGRGKPIWSSFTPGNKSWYCKEVPTYPHSIDKANSILDALGWKDTDGDGIREDDKGRKISFKLNTNVENNVRQQIGTLIKNDLALVGVEVNFKPVTFADLGNSLQDSHQWDMILLGWGSGVPPDPANGKNITTSSGRLHAWYPQQPSPATEWEARVDHLMSMMDQELDDTIRKKYNDEIQVLFGENIPILYIAAANSYAVIKKDRLGNIWPSVLRPQLTWNLEEVYIRQ